ncbi:MAG: hypothetical protein IT299_10985 [Dehalococcoidia bacterium]|nr:hypothetical protein [Dehalococcoidia bacterium]
MPIDRLLEDGAFSAAATGYEVRLPRDEEHWLLANEFAEEEAVCCPSLGLQVEERDEEIVVRAAF